LAIAVVLFSGSAYDPPLIGIRFVPFSVAQKSLAFSGESEPFIPRAQLRVLQ
jgi:hypothetical protein